MLTAKEADSIRSTAISLSKKIDQNHYLIGKILNQLATERVDTLSGQVYIHQLWGFKSRFDWAERELGMRSGAAKTCERIYKRFGIKLKGKINQSQILSKTKMTLLMKVINTGSTKDSISKWFNLAAKSDCTDLELEINRFFGKGNVKHKRITYGFNVSPEQQKIIKDATNYVYKTSGGAIKNNGDAIELIINEWLELKKLAAKANVMKKSVNNKNRSVADLS